VKQDPHRSAQLVVLKAYDFPSVLIELGFLSNKDDESELVSPKWRDTTADSIVTAVDRFFASHAADAAQ
jgi:N-acetylmuramoyl-L-alanine amidase